MDGVFLWSLAMFLVLMGVLVGDLEGDKFADDLFLLWYLSFDGVFL